MTQQAKENAGFTLPAPVEGEQAPAAPATPATGTAETVQSLPVTTDVDTSSRDALIGGGVLLVLFIAFFFAKNAYANTLVAKRIQPGKANAAGWWLFIFLASLSTGVVLAAINAPKFMAPLIIGPLTLIGLIALVLMLLSSRK
ncbi:hypothetical protein RCH14_000468 [Massilia sp. MP_M2]|uniref:hypothetical protein n=1 Tax=Massilia sp. MP_M2 TaxID=3071713 RepID=UPI00319DEA4E